MALERSFSSFSFYIHGFLTLIWLYYFQYFFRTFLYYKSPIEPGLAVMGGHKGGVTALIMSGDISFMFIFGMFIFLSVGGLLAANAWVVKEESGQ
jgi:hypothetical protein